MSIEALLKRITVLFATIEQQQQEQAASFRVVLYNPETKQPLPGFEPSANGPHIFLPDNGRDDYSTVFMLPAVEHERRYKA